MASWTSMASFWRKESASAPRRRRKCRGRQSRRGSPRLDRTRLRDRHRSPAGRAGLILIRKEETMRTHLLGFIGALAFLVGLQTADAAPFVPNGSTLASPPTVLPVKHHCGKGQRWIPAGYAAKGKYRPGHCAPVSPSASSTTQ